MRIILASGSPRRQELLRTAGLKDFTVAPTDADETVPESLAPDETVLLLSRRKAAAAEAQPEDIVIAADTVVSLDGEILGKPKDEADARRMLKALSGRAHSVYTGVTVRRGDEKLAAAEETRVHFRKLGEDEIEAYIKSGEPMDKAGAYGIQGLACTFAERLEGDYFNVMGLPMARLNAMLDKFGVKLLK